MVLSNKKLKQKIREDLVKSLSVSVAEDSVPNLQSQSLKELLDSASHKPRLSKREKRRISEPSDGIRDKEVEGSVENGELGEKNDKKDKKKRKRDETVESELGEAEGDEDTKEEDKSQKKKQKKKKKKKKRKTKKAEEDNVEEKVKVEEEEIQVDTESKEEEDGVIPNKLYVGGIPYQSTEDEIRSYFRSCGVITKVDCKMRPEDGAFSGIAFITFQTEDGANRALAFDRAAMGDRFLTIQQYVKTTPSIPRRITSSGFAPEMVDGYNRVYIGNLAWNTTERDIRKLFSDCVITSVRLGKNKETGEFKGYAHVDFKDNVSVAMALKLDQQVISGRPVKICCALKDRPEVDHSTNPTPDETNNMEETVANEVNDGNYFAAIVSSGKVKRRSCYECGEKGHLSTGCPKKHPNLDDQTNSKLDQETISTRPSYMQENNYGSYYMNETYGATNEASDGSLVASAVSSKIKRRACYECGEKGHLSTACPKKHPNLDDQTNSKLDQETISTRPSYMQENNYGSYYMNETYVEANNVSLVASAVSSKIKRRACYECGEKGHLSTACPKKLRNNDQQNSKVDHVEVINGGSYIDETYTTDPITANGANEEGSLTSAVSKIKRRNCYECGEKGHLSSACPKKQQKQG